MDNYEENIDYSLIWEDFKRGNKDAFSQLYRGFFDVLFRYGMKFIADSEIVKDCIHDLFVKLYNGRESLSPNVNLKFYLLFSLKNLIIDHLSKYSRLTYVSAEDLPFIATYHPLAVEDNREDGIDDEIKEKFDRVMSLLNNRQKEALYLHYQLELTYEEISELLGINCQSSRNLIHRAISKVRKNMPLTVFLSILCS